MAEHKTVRQFTLTPKSENTKTGPIGVSTSPMQTCPVACPFRGRGCYNNYGPMGNRWKVCSLSGSDPCAGYAFMLDQVRAKVPEGAMWRHNQAGDLVGNGYVIEEWSARRLAAANKGKHGFTYTHYPVISQSGVTESQHKWNRTVVERMNAAGFAVNISCNSTAHADKVADSGIKAPITCILPEQVKKDGVKSVLSPAGRKITVCPSVTTGKTCVECKLCAIPNRKTIIGFPCHGSGKKRAEEVGMEWATGDFVPMVHKRKDKYQLRHVFHAGKDGVK